MTFHDMTQTAERTDARDPAQYLRIAGPKSTARALVLSNGPPGPA